MPESVIGAATAVSVFDGLSDDDLAEVEAALELRSFQPGSIIVEEGDTVHDMYILRRGSAEVLVVGRDGGAHAVGHIAPPGSVGEMSFLASQPAAATVRAVDEVEAVRLEQESLGRLAERFPLIYRNIGAILARRLAQTNRLAAKRGASLVTLLCDVGGPALLPHALAASLAWHSRRRTALVFADPDQYGRLPADYRHGTAGRLVTVSVSAPASLERDVAEAADTHDHVLVVATASLLDRQHQTIFLAGANPPPLPPDASVVAGWTSAAKVGNGRVDVPEPSRAELDDVRAGMLPAEGPAGRALGSVARRIGGFRIGLAFGAGSIRGFAHVGVLRHLQRLGIQPDVVAGTSVGAAVAPAAAQGRPPDEIADILERCGQALFRLGVPVRGLLSNRGVRKFIHGVMGETLLEELPVPTATIAADLDTQQEVVLRRGLVWIAIMASISIPGVYPPLRVGPHRLVDGGVLNPVPADVAAGLGADVVVAVRLLTPPAIRVDDAEAVPGNAKRPPTALGTILRSIEMMQTGIGARFPDVTTITLAPRLTEIKGARLRHFADGRRFITDGEEAAEAATGRLAAALPWVKG